MSFHEKQAMHDAMYHDMLSQPSRKLSFGMISYWVLTLLEARHGSITELDNIEAEWQQAIIRHTPDLHPLLHDTAAPSTQEKSPQEKNMPHKSRVARRAIKNHFNQTACDISESPQMTLKFLALAALDDYAADPQTHIHATGLTQNKLDDITADIKDNLSHIAAPSVVTTLREFSQSSETCHLRLKAAGLVKSLSFEAHYKYGVTLNP